MKHNTNISWKRLVVAFSGAVTGALIALVLIYIILVPAEASRDAEDGITWTFVISSGVYFIFGILTGCILSLRMFSGIRQNSGLTSNGDNS